MKKHLIFLTAALASTTLAQAVIIAPVVTLSPSQDTTIYENNTDNSNGAGQFLFVGNTNNNISNSPRRALLSFDISSVVPAGATINSASLSLTVSRSISGDQSTSLHRLTSDWGEAGSDAAGQEGGGTLAVAGDATWTSNVSGTSSWATAGGDFVGGASATSLVGAAGTTPTWSGAGLIADVQGWLDDPSQNFGWALVGNESTQATAKRFGSGEGAASPSLQITFTPVPEPSSSWLLLIGWAVAFRRRRL